MTRERIVGFLLGISVGTVMGFYLRPAQANPPQNQGKRAEADGKKPAAAGLRNIGDRAAARGGNIASAGSST